MIHENRINRRLHKGIRPQGEYVLYWMQGAQRITDNHALAYAIALANQLEVPLVVSFVVIPRFPGGNTRHYQFMLEGIKCLKPMLEQMGIGFSLKAGDPLLIISEMSEKAKVVVMDFAYGVFERELREALVQKLDCDTYEVETNVVVPVNVAYNREAYAAYAIRPSIMKQIHTYLTPVHHQPLEKSLGKISESIAFGSLPLNEIRAFLDDYCPDLERLPKSDAFIGGEQEAMRHLDVFLSDGIYKYDQAQSDPAVSGTSRLSPYLHFGQLSPVTILNKLFNRGIKADAFVEQLVVRRELAFNYVYYAGERIKTIVAFLPAWAYETLDHHRNDKRDFLYPLEVLEKGLTHDPYWNAAQREMVKTGHMHNTMRMYWGKKVIEWSRTPEEAFERLCTLNDKYQLDGRDPNGYAGIAWCFGKHDRPWQERAIFGKIRYMNAAGLERKYDIKSYVSHVEALLREET